MTKTKPENQENTILQKIHMADIRKEKGKMEINV